MKNKIGVMQGRLLPKYQGRYQAFPVGMWQDEFQIAQDIGLDLIEFILDANDIDENPLMSDNGVEKIKSVAQKTGVSVQTVCADYFMEKPLHSSDVKIVKEGFSVLERLLDSAEKLNITDIVIPCVDQSSLSSKDALKVFTERLSEFTPILEKKNINFSLETDLSPQIFSNLIDQINSKNITINYDVGNSAALGYDCEEELACYGNRITDIHIKDRKFRGGPTMLGEGNANFSKFFKKLSDFNYEGPFIMQAYRDDEGVRVFKKQLNWINKFLKDYQ